jgi:hypothetical protein
LAKTSIKRCSGGNRVDPGSLSGPAYLRAEIGRIYKTVHDPPHPNDEQYRRRMGRKLNKGEASHELSRFLCFGKEGALRGREFGDQLHTFSCLSVLHNAVVAWNMVHIEPVVEQLRAEGQRCDDELLSLTTPLLRTLLAPILQYFFTEHLTSHKQVSPRTIVAYRDSFRLLLQFLKKKTGKQPSTLVRGTPLSSDGLDYILQQAVERATEACPSLLTKRVTPHLRRHYLPFRTMSGNGESLSIWPEIPDRVAESLSESPDIVLCLLQTVQEGEESVAGFQHVRGRATMR